MNSPIKMRRTHVVWSFDSSCLTDELIRESLRRDKALRRHADEASSHTDLASDGEEASQQKSQSLPKQKKGAGVRSLAKEKIHGSQRKPA